MVKISKLDEEINEEIGNKIKECILKNIEKYEINEYAEILEEIKINLDAIIKKGLEDVLEIYAGLQEKFHVYLINLDFDGEATKEQKKFAEYLKKIFNYTEIIKKIDKKLAENLDVKVCPYCNRMYTTTVYGKLGRTRPEFDHFYPKSRFGLLALTISNIIPSCHVCNITKSKKICKLEYNIYPYNEGCEEELIFDYKMVGIDKYKIYTIKDASSKINNNIKMLNLEQIYATAHSNVVNDLVEKYIFYSKYKDELNNLISKNGNISDYEILKMLGYTDKEKIKDTSLAKLKNDILDKLKDVELL